MELIVLALFVFIGAISGQTMMPVCRCSQLNSCMQQEMQKMQTCAMSTQCLSVLGGNRNQVSSCLTQKMQRGPSMDDCLKMKLANMGCTNSTNPMQVRSNMMNMMNQQPMMTDRSAFGQFYTCVHNCMMGSSNSGSQQSMMMNKADCMQQLGCQLDMSMWDINAIVMGAQSCSMMAPPPMPMMMNNNNMMMNNNQQMMMNNNNMMMPMSSPAMMWLMPQDCQCLMNAGVQISCNNMMMNNMMMNNNNMMMNNNNNMMTNNRGRRSSSE